ncbi:MAG TPA: GntR family transcriptional regulator [Thermoleophilaceae bacterium]|jgi:DNA-binding GntR family transcriptional regulator|nr:GntR family transcriptional regulator [Thermoleophilaceae bacterium]
MPGQLISLAERRSGVPARTQVYATLRDAIIRAELPPGRKLSENELATWLGVSRTPIREALVRLRDERLVAIVPQLGTFVSYISPQAVSDASFIREALECAAIRQTAVLATEDDIASLEENLRAQERAGERGDFDTFYVLDEDFHRVLCDLSGHATVWAVSQRAKGHLNRIRRLSIPMPTYIGEMIAEHRDVVAAVAEHDPDLAEERLRHHLRMVLREIPQIRSENPDYFEEP